MTSGPNERLRALPAVDRVMSLLVGVPPRLAAGAARRAVDAARERVLGGEDVPAANEVAADARALLAADRRTTLLPVINATGVLIHTNLGRVPLGAEQLAAVTEVAGGYSNLELDLDAGARGTRYSHARSLMTELTGAEDALVVNNCAAAVLLALKTLCDGREVVVSRGELIEIGGEFRVPDLMAASGARLVEVGTTNRTHLSDYERAIRSETAALMKVHPSNYRVVGFTSSVDGRALARLARERGLPFIHDLGSGLIEMPAELDWTDETPGWQAEPLVSQALAEGADLVTFSGDKLLGGPQAGIIAGRADLVRRLAASPLLRALRVDKMTLAALQATLTAHLQGRAGSLPLWEMARAPLAELESRAREITRLVAGGLSDDSSVKVEAVPSRAVAGGGSLPGAELGSWAVAVVHPERGADELARALRWGDPAVVGRIQDGVLLLDLRSVPAESDEGLARALGDGL